MRSGLTSKHCRFEELVDYFNRELQRGQAETIENHLADCVHCREQLSRLKFTLEAVGSTGHIEHNSLYSSRFPQLVLNRIPKRQTSQWLRRLAVAATIIVVVTALVGEILAPDVIPPSAGPRRSVEVDMFPKAGTFNDVVDDYWIETATTDELLHEVGALDQEIIMALLEEIRL